MCQNKKKFGGGSPQLPVKYPQLPHNFICLTGTLICHKNHIMRIDGHYEEILHQNEICQNYQKVGKVFK